MYALYKTKSNIPAKKKAWARYGAHSQADCANLQRFSFYKRKIYGDI